MTPRTLDRSLVATLPTPLAHHLQELLDEEEPRSADELSEFLAVLLEYIAALALADYLACKTAKSNPSLDGWLVSTLSSGRVGLGLWLRWTQLAVKATPNPNLSCLTAYVAANDLNDPNSDLSWLLGFRNDVMHGGFVASLPKIKAAKVRLEQLLVHLAPLWQLQVRGCIAGQDSWLKLSGLEPCPAESPQLSEEGSAEPGAVLLCDGDDRALLRLDPICSFSDEGLTLQHDWRTHHETLFLRTRLAAFFERYLREREGLIDTEGWRVRCQEALPPGGYRDRETVQLALQRLVDEPGLQLRLVGAPGSGRSTLLSRLSESLDRPVPVLPVTSNSVTCDPEVLRRWVAQTLSRQLLGQSAPAAALKSAPRPKEQKAVEAWQKQLAQALETQSRAPILAIDDADAIGSGIYAGQSCSGCLGLVRQLGISLLMVQRPSGQPPGRGDGAVNLDCWTVEELSAWGDDPQTLHDETGGYTAWLANPDATPKRLREDLERRFVDPLSQGCFEALSAGNATCLVVADRLEANGHQVFTPQVELLLRQHLDWLETEKAQVESKDVLRYRLHPAVARLMEASP